MKKIVAAFTLFSGIFTMSAQEVTPLSVIQVNVDHFKQYAESDALFVYQKLELEDDKLLDLENLFYNKYKMLHNDSSQASIQEISDSVINRLKSILTTEEYNRLAQLEGVVEKISGLVYLNGN